jgi:hypothetical protein
MGQVSASSTVVIDAEPETMFGGSRGITRPSAGRSSPRSTAPPPGARGGQRAGTVATGKLQATKSRVRDVKVNVDVAGHTVIERDANSTMVINWTVAPAGPGSSVTVKTSWQGAGGIGGFFEKTFARLGLRKIQGEVLVTSRSKSRAGKRPDIDDRGLEDLAARSSEAARDTATTASAYF